MPPIRIALIGAGVFARDAHVPSLRNLTDHFEIAAVYSRTAATAQALATEIGPHVQVYTDLAALLLTPDIDAVNIVLPIPVMPPVVAQALASGKHVISEKPLAPTVRICRQLLAAYQRPAQVWMVGENWRYESAYVQAAQLVAQGAIGQPVTCQMALYLPTSPTSKYFHTLWRRNGGFAGGALLDGGVHHVAAMRLVVGEIAAVTAMTTHTSTAFATADTLSATLHFANGAVGSYLVTYANGAPWPGYLHVVGDRGALRVQRGEIEVTCDGQTERIQCPKFDGVHNELVAFANSIITGEPHLNTPAEALLDVAVIEAMLESAQQKTQVSIKQ
ncbi:MAG: Gfo/Idh/MocA family oxidoreductase [Caldilineaceae bacterium]|nr:Gfo/Idh/MocA family oxidoreductase [Caldilineaceae bacterium]